jgi:PPOX class probable F420-dependent enzyme
MPTLPAHEARRLFASGRVAYLATLRLDGTAALVPIVFDVIGERIVSLVDPKPKRTLDVARLTNITRDPRVTLLVDRYAEDWDLLWWARAEGEAHVVKSGPEHDEASSRIRSKYPQYKTLQGSFGDAIVVRVSRWSGWSAR